MKTNFYECDLYPGAIIGESALGGIDKRLQTAVAITPCDFLVIDIEDYILIDEQGAVKKMSMNEKYEFLKEIPILKSYGNYDVFKLAQALKAENISKDSVLLRRAQVSPYLYFIYNGKLDIVSDIDDKSALAILQKHDYFGESSILRHSFFGATRQKSQQKDHISSSAYHFLECFDARAASSIEVLVLHASHFYLIDKQILGLMKSSYISRMKWRAERADLVHEEKCNEKKMRRKLLESHTPIARPMTSMPRINSSFTVGRSGRSPNSSSPSKVDISDLPTLNDRINPITLLATSKNAIYVKKNKKLLDKMNTKMRPRTAIPSSGFTSLFGSPVKTIHCEFAMNLRGSSSDKKLQDFLSSRPEVSIDEPGADLEGPECVSVSASLPATSAGATRMNVISGSQKIPSMTSYCQYLGEF